MNKNHDFFYFVDDISQPFVANDIQMVARNYQKVYLFSTEELDNKSSLPPNVSITEMYMDWHSYRKARTFITHFFPCLFIYINECWKKGKIFPFLRSLAVLNSNIFKANEIVRHINKMRVEVDKSVFYSFWFYDCIYLAWLKKKYPFIHVVTRTHSGDLYESHVSIKDKILFRNFQFRYLDNVYPVSDLGSHYFAVKYPTFAKKVKTMYLGSTYHEKMNPFSDGPMCLVSCAGFRHHKRIHRIAEALLYVDIPLTWVHFGDEKLEGQDPKIQEYIVFKEKLKQKQNITFIPQGHKSNNEILEFYSNTTVNLFISLSAIEGIPVSMMEAGSYGIPILSTDVGACSEIVNQNTGELIPLETSVKDVAGIITNFMNSCKNTEEFRKGVRQFWQEKFNAEKNYNYFFKELDQIQK